MSLSKHFASASELRPVDLNPFHFQKKCPQSRAEKVVHPCEEAYERVAASRARR